jgi:hypothetical protein
MLAQPGKHGRDGLDGIDKRMACASLLIRSNVGKPRNALSLTRQFRSGAPAEACHCVIGQRA